MTNNPRWMGLLVFIQTPVILAVVAIVAGESVFLFTLLGLMVGGASFLVSLWVAARHRQMKGREVVKSRITRSLLVSKIRLRFLVATPIIVLFGVLNINTLGAIEWVALITFWAVLMAFCGFMWAVADVRSTNRPAR